MQVLALDFDGVISDSAPEALVVALRSYAMLCPDSKLARGVSNLGTPTRSQVQAHRLYQRFVELMPLGNRAEDYAVTLIILEGELSVADQPEYDRVRAAQDEDFLAAFHSRFYAQRTRFAHDERAAWLGLLGPYAPVLDVLRRRRDDAVLALATAKDRASVKILLDAYGIEDLFPDERILDKETGVSKRAHLAALRERLSAPWQDITFVDDKLNHLESVAGLGVRCVLAAWGYNGERERSRARQCGFEVCALDEVEATLFDAAYPRVDAGPEGD
jgi:phosphoglycolate phosphatase-like HAD superfamily hydrolase